MSYTYSPWDYVPSDNPVWRAPDGSGVLEYSGSEICMGGPLIGSLLCKRNGGMFIYLGYRCGCPAVWSEDGRYLAFPVWIRERATYQRLGLADFKAMNLGLSSRTMSVLHLRGFSGSRLVVTDSPLTHATDDSWDIFSMSFYMQRPLELLPWPEKGLDRELDETLRDRYDQWFTIGGADSDDAWDEKCSRNQRAWLQEKRSNPPDAGHSGRIGYTTVGSGKISGHTAFLLLIAPFLLLINLVQYLIYGLMRLGMAFRGNEIAPLDAREQNRLKDKAFAIAVFPLTLLGRLIEWLRSK